LFDAIAAKCVPVYIGENLADYKFLKNCVVQLTPKVSSIMEFFEQENQQIYNEKKKYLDNVENYATDLETFSLDNCSSEIANIVYRQFVSKN